MSELAGGAAAAGASGGDIRLRPHHLICLQFYRGEGYSAGFVENLNAVVDRASMTPALVVEDADDVCAACPSLSAEGLCLDPGEGAIEGLDTLALAVLGLSAGARLTLVEARELLGDDAVAVGHWRATACDGCQWESTCESGWGALLGAAEKAALQDRTPLAPQRL